MRNTHPVPTAAIRIPAKAGPTVRARLNEVEFSATAFDRFVLSDELRYE